MNKYMNRKTVVDGQKFDSKKEANRWTELKLMERAGLITDLKRQVKFVLTPAQYDERGKCILHTSVYIADFVYRKNRRRVVEDGKKKKKGPAYNLFMLKKKIMYDKYKIFVEEI